ncbi:unnamed protein product [Cyclocybe aegerita]|uniref:F-box domain-containing protein n=1 Tax=Cyclocybe aegerita TaxID=1973307 RepID=A0A8S0XNG2_CYCAE|nr:unnamed protein product [Cyclocybe aegerita]
MSSIAHNPTGLVDLPLEMLVEVMKQLEWDDFLRMRQTCRHMCKVSNARPIWLYFFEKYLRSTIPGPFHPDKPVQDYSSYELESLVLRRKGTEVAEGRFPRQRKLHLGKPSSDILSNMHLVHGGRWLLHAVANGSVEYVDLDTSEHIARPLTPPPYDESACVMASMVVDMDMATDDLPTDRSLVFNLGLLLWRMPRYDAEIIKPTSLPSMCIQVWRITFQNDCQGGSLLAQCLSAFPEEAIANPRAFSLFWGRIAYSLCFVGEHARRGRCVVVVNWQLANASEMGHQRRYRRLWGQNLASPIRQVACC